MNELIIRAFVKEAFKMRAAKQLMQATRDLPKNIKVVGRNITPKRVEKALINPKAAVTDLALNTKVQRMAGNLMKGMAIPAAAGVGLYTTSKIIN